MSQPPPRLMISVEHRRIGPEPVSAKAWASSDRVIGRPWNDEIVTHEDDALAIALRPVRVRGRRARRVARGVR